MTLELNEGGQLWGRGRWSMLHMTPFHTRIHGMHHVSKHFHRRSQLGSAQKQHKSLLLNNIVSQRKLFRVDVPTS